MGDKVMINPDYYDEDLIEPYLSNGPNHVYTVTSVKEFETYLMFGLDGERETWDNDTRYLLLLETVSDSEFVAASNDDLSLLLNV